MKRDGRKKKALINVQSGAKGIKSSNRWGAECKRYITIEERWKKLAKHEKTNNSEELIEKIDGFHDKKCWLLSLNIEDLYYSLKMDFLFFRLRKALEAGLVHFQSAAGNAVDDFFELIKLFLTTNVTVFWGAIMTQKEGVCMGSGISRFGWGAPEWFG